MLIDFHTHIFPDKIAKSTIEALEQKSNSHAYTDGSVNGLLSAMERANADICVTLPVLTKPEQFDGVNRFAKSVNERFKDEKRRLVSFAGIHPKCDDIKGKMQFIKDNGFLGVKIHPDYQNAYIDDEGYLDILHCAKNLDLIVVTHSGVDAGYIGQPIKCPPSLTKKVIKDVKPQKFVLGHYGGHLQWEEVLELLTNEDGIYLDTAFTFEEIDPFIFKSILTSIGSDKVLFATDCPWRDIKTEKERLLKYNLGKDVEERIFYKNALKLLGL